MEVLMLCYVYVLCLHLEVFTEIYTSQNILNMLAQVTTVLQYRVAGMVVDSYDLFVL